MSKLKLVCTSRWVKFGWHNCLGNLKEATWRESDGVNVWTKQKDTNVLWLFLLLGLKWPKHGSACIFCVLQKGQSFVYLFGRDINIDEWTAPKDIYNQSQYLALHKMFSIFSLWLKTAVTWSQFKRTFSTTNWCIRWKSRAGPVNHLIFQQGHGTLSFAQVPKSESLALLKRHYLKLLDMNSATLEIVGTVQCSRVFVLNFVTGLALAVL